MSAVRHRLLHLAASAIHSMHHMAYTEGGSVVKRVANTAVTVASTCHHGTSSRGQIERPILAIPNTHKETHTNTSTSSRGQTT